MYTCNPNPRRASSLFKCSRRQFLGSKVPYAASLGFGVRSSAAEQHESYESILDRALTFLHRPTFEARPHSFSSLSQTPPNVFRHLHPLKRELWTASPAFERARMAFQFASAGASCFGSNAGGTSNAQTQTGPDLLEVQTEVRLAFTRSSILLKNQ